MPRTNAAADLAAKLIEALRGVRQHSEPYPLTVAELTAKIVPPPSQPEVERALAKKPFAQALLRARKKDPASPVGLAEDLELLAGSDLLLEYALRRLCTAVKPLHPVPRVVKQVDASLQSAFTTAVQRRLDEGRLPMSAGTLEVKGKTHLYLRAFPPPPPPPPKKHPAVELSERLVQALEQSRSRSDGGYPPTLQELTEQAAPQAKAAAIKQATGREPFRSRVVFVAAKRLPESPVALLEDIDQVASSPLLVGNALTAARTPKNQAVSISDMKKKVGKTLQAAFVQGVERRIQEGTLPPEVGHLRIKGRVLLFLTADIAANRVAVPVPQPARTPILTPAVNFAQRFDQVFEHLDRERGGHNLVSLVDLRRKLEVDRATFDAELTKLRRAGRYSLSGAEGRHGIGTEEHAAGIVEGGNLLLFVSRKEC